MNVDGIILLFLLILSIAALFLWANAEFRNKENYENLIKRTKELEASRKDLRRKNEEMDSVFKKTKTLEETVQRVAKAIRSSNGQDLELVKEIHQILSNGAPKSVMGMRKPGGGLEKRDENEAKDIFRGIQKGLGSD
ncbi:MAG: hypothetical protein OEZ47_14275 [Gammaproteobacteria bacterium]|nr:hypothetical protein [Gammaproteobacteria bacterium]